jgi:hypothetical protein
MNPITALLSILGVATVDYIAGWGAAIRKARRLPDALRAPATDARTPTPFQIALWRRHQLPRRAGNRIVRDSWTRRA